MTLRRVTDEPTSGVGPRLVSGDITSSPRLTGCPPELRGHIEAALRLAEIPDRAYREFAYAAVTRTPAARVFYGYTSYSVSSSGDLRLRSNTEPLVLLRRWLVLLALGPGVLRDVEFASEARCVAVRPARERPRRRNYRPEAPISPAANRALRQQLAELKRRPEAGTA